MELYAYDHVKGNEKASSVGKLNLAPLESSFRRAVEMATATHMLLHLASDDVRELHRNGITTKFPRPACEQVVLCLTGEAGSLGSGADALACRIHPMGHLAADWKRVLLFAQDEDALREREVFEAWCQCSVEDAIAIVEGDAARVSLPLQRLFRLVNSEPLEALALLAEGYLMAHGVLEQPAGTQLTVDARSVVRTGYWWLTPFSRSAAVIAALPVTMKAAWDQLAESQGECEEFGSISKLVDSILASTAQRDVEIELGVVQDALNTLRRAIGHTMPME